MKRRAPRLAAALLAMYAAPALAERTADAPVDRFGVIDGAKLELSAGTEGDRASIGLELPSGPSQEWRFGLILSTPLNGGDEAMPATLDGLANGTKATLRFGRFDVPMASPDALANEIERQAREECTFKRQASQNMSGAKPVGGCASEPVNNIVHEYAQPRYREYLAHMLPYDARDWGFETSIGVNDFEFVDPATLSEQKERKVQWSAAGYYTQYLRRSKTAFTLSAGYERAYEAADEEIFCPPNPGNVIITCTTARGAPPERDESLLFAAGLRHQFMRKGTLLNLAVAPQVTYDALDDVVGVDVPVYFLPNSNSGLTGGVRFGYRSDREDKFSVGIFIGAAFSVFQ